MQYSEHEDGSRHGSSYGNRPTSSGYYANQGSGYYGHQHNPDSGYQNQHSWHQAEYNSQQHNPARGGQYGSGNPYRHSGQSNQPYGDYRHAQRWQGQSQHYGAQAPNSQYGQQQYSNNSNYLPRYEGNDGYAHGRPFVPENRGWWDRASDEVSAWFGDDEAERRRRMDHFDADPYPRDYYGRRFRDERLREQARMEMMANTYYGPPYGPNTGIPY